MRIAIVLCLLIATAGCITDPEPEPQAKRPTLDDLAFQVSDNTQSIDRLKWDQFYDRFTKEAARQAQLEVSNRNDQAAPVRTGALDTRNAVYCYDVPAQPPAPTPYYWGRTDINEVRRIMAITGDTTLLSRLTPTEKRSHRNASDISALDGRVTRLEGKVENLGVEMRAGFQRLEQHFGSEP